MYQPRSDQTLAAREFLAAALYMALVLLAALVALPKEALPGDTAMVSLLIGTAVGLILAHWVAFRLAAALTTEGGVPEASAAREAVAQISGGVLVGVIAAVPYMLWDDQTAYLLALLLLAIIPGAAGVAIARLRSKRWPTALLLGGLVCLLGLGVVLVKAYLMH